MACLPLDNDPEDRKSDGRDCQDVPAGPRPLAQVVGLSLVGSPDGPKRENDSEEHQRAHDERQHEPWKLVIAVEDCERDGRYEHNQRDCKTGTCCSYAPCD